VRDDFMREGTSSFVGDPDHVIAARLWRSRQRRPAATGRRSLSGHSANNWLDRVRCQWPYLLDALLPDALLLGVYLPYGTVPYNQ
jgi:hypothetical protein